MTPSDILLKFKDIPQLSNFKDFNCNNNNKKKSFLFEVLKYIEKPTNVSFLKNKLSEEEINYLIDNSELPLVKIHNEKISFLAQSFFENLTLYPSNYINLIKKTDLSYQDKYKHSATTIYFSFIDTNSFGKEVENMMRKSLSLFSEEDITTSMQYFNNDIEKIEEVLKTRKEVISLEQKRKLEKQLSKTKTTSKIKI